MSIFLAQGAESSGSILVWSVVLLLLILVGFGGVVWLRRWLKSLDADDGAPQRLGFTLSDLREMHRQGKLTDEEYERARTRMMANAKAAAAKLPPVVDPNRRSARATSGEVPAPPTPRE